jgi:hypothetical protein
MQTQRAKRFHRTPSDRYQPHELGEENGDLEPSLAGCPSVCDAGQDLELDTADDEPWLGAPENPEGDQSHLSDGDSGGPDAEADPTDGAAWRLLSQEQQDAASAAARQALDQLREKAPGALGVAGHGILQCASSRWC